MRNYKSRIPIGNGKWAYSQLPDFAKDANLHVTRLLSLVDATTVFFSLSTRWPFGCATISSPQGVVL